MEEMTGRNAFRMWKEEEVNQLFHDVKMFGSTPDHWVCSRFVFDDIGYFLKQFGIDVKIDIDAPPRTLYLVSRSPANE